MEPKLLFIVFFYFTITFNLFSFSVSNLQTYIIQLHPHSFANSSFDQHTQWHLSFLERALESDESPSTRLLYSYHSAMEGFSASLSECELMTIKSMPEVIAVRPDRLLQIHTTYSYKFLGLSPVARGGAWLRTGFGRGTIVGILDTGVWPESPSFSDHLMPPVPKKWRGICQEGEKFNSLLCNRKLIGARFYTKGHRASATPSMGIHTREYISARDAHGHGTHTSSTAAGAAVPMANVLGMGAGEARGMAPGAHVAIYKVCWFSGCYSSDIVAAMDDAIRDGVDVLSLSLGGFPIPLFEDSIAIGSFRAIEHGVTVICAAGNNGPITSSVANEAPWITTVGASTLDRRFPAILRLGNGEVLYGESLYPGKRQFGASKELELVYVSGADDGSEFCFKGSLPRSKVRGKMVVCDRGTNGRAEKGQIVKESGGAALILTNTVINLDEDSVDAHVLPATLIGYRESIRLKNYITSTRKPTARIEFGGTVIGKSRAPAVALFSSRGPSLTNPSVLKPDLIAPGVNIIAAWPQNLGPTGLPQDSRRVNFTVLSGTSMACPHVSGIAALVRSFHPTWSPAAVKSAIMTTTDYIDHYGKPIMDGSKPAEVFAMGAGQVNPERATNPGLVYNIMPYDYIIHLCTLGYARTDIFTITHRSVNCHEILAKNKGFSLNYPSMTVIFKYGKTSSIIRRRLTNVGSPNSTYSVMIKAPAGVKLRVKPQHLTFNHVYQTLSYRVWFTSKKRRTASQMIHAQGYLKWVHTRNSYYSVRSPISITWA
ncbi:hypothetical protein MKW98_008413 [Papaver atlanticum]|uniref:Subtilisin-like protease SBT1.2 n=1 Tax=Papaver atlanticum TaxID=357466 RepID=A0AAD4SIU0_9MAGN|nr:hypothetical protein MKW98_008413 [Papaver atlanticum]